MTDLMGRIDFFYRTTGDRRGDVMRAILVKYGKKFVLRF